MALGAASSSPGRKKAKAGVLAHVWRICLVGCTLAAKLYCSAGPALASEMGIGDEKLNNEKKKNLEILYGPEPEWKKMMAQLTCEERKKSSSAVLPSAASQTAPHKTLPDEAVTILKLLDSGFRAKDASDLKKLECFFPSFENSSIYRNKDIIDMDVIAKEFKENMNCGVVINLKRGFLETTFHSPDGDFRGWVTINLALRVANYIDLEIRYEETPQKDSNGVPNTAMDSWKSTFIQNFFKGFDKYSGIFELSSGRLRLVDDISEVEYAEHKEEEENYRRRAWAKARKAEWCELYGDTTSAHKMFQRREMMKRVHMIRTIDRLDPSDTQERIQALIRGNYMNELEDLLEASGLSVEPEEEKSQYYEIRDGRLVPCEEVPDQSPEQSGDDTSETYGCPSDAEMTSLNHPEPKLPSPESEPETGLSSTGSSSHASRSSDGDVSANPDSEFAANKAVFYGAISGLAVVISLFFVVAAIGRRRERRLPRGHHEPLQDLRKRIDSL